MTSSDNRARIVEAARALFAKRGFAAVSVDDVAGAVGLTKGAVYYQFADKKDLFRAACAAVLNDIVARVARDAMTHTEHHVEEVITGAEDLFDAFETPEARRLLLVEAPAVLGMAEWTDMHEKLRTELGEHALGHLADAGLIQRGMIPMLAHLLFGAFMQGVLQIAAANDVKAASRRARSAYRRLAQGLLQKPG